MKFELLGPVRALSDEGIAQMLNRQERMVLALLLISAGKPVSMNRTIDALWPISPPRSARSVVHNHICSLRRMLREDSVDHNRAIGILNSVRANDS